jgi:hypothetical protein
MITIIKPRYLVACLLIILPVYIQAQEGFLISTGTDQKQLLKAYRLVLEKSSDDYRNGSAPWDNLLFPGYGEHSVYWITGGVNKGSFVYPGGLPQDYQRLAGSAYSNYNLTAQSQVSVQFKKHPKRIAVFKSKHKANNVTLTWETIYFERLFSEHLMDDVLYTVNEDTLTGQGLNAHTTLLIIPAFISKELDYKYYIDSIFTVTPGLNTCLQSYIARGGSIYAEGNGVYFLEKAGYLENGAVEYQADDNGNGLATVTELSSAGVLNLGFGNTGSKLYGSRFPVIHSSRIIPVASLPTANPCIFMLKAENASGSKIICNTGMPTVSGLSDNDGEITQVNWTMAAILSAFTYDVDVTRKVRNELTGSMAAGDNAVSYDRDDTLAVEIRVRNLSDQTVTGITIEENINPYFTFLGVTSGDSYTQSGSRITFSGLSLPAYSEKIIVYQVMTPDPASDIHEDVDSYISRGTLIAVSMGNITYSQGGFNNRYIKDKDFADLLFSASIFADTDVNWKNFLNLEYQPFKVFMIMENKSRSPALNTIYTQYIPKDVPFYWSDNVIDIPILKTPGGKYVDVLRGSNDEAHPEYDMDSDGHPDVWLDTASIFPKGYILTEEAVYWANPWNYLRTGNDDFVFEDIDHDGEIAVDNNGDGIADVEEPGDKIRVWKVTWNLGRVEGYEYHDPYSSYEIWVDPPDLVPLAAGVGYAHDSIADPYPGMFYPYTENINSADLSDTTWSHWMERDGNGKVIWKQLVHQRINNYEGFTFIDTSDVNYRPLPTDSIIGTCPQPHREFLAVLSLGGEEIDMTHYTPHQSLYSKIDYKTVFGEDRVTPIRTTYSYWAPLPNPLQFEYLSNNYQIMDTLGQPMQELPEYGKARLVFDMDASTEYTYYWIRNCGHDVDYNDPSEATEGIENLGDGVFGYFVYAIPKGMGGYRITLPKNDDGTYNTDSIVKINGLPFTKWLDNPNTRNAVEIWETPFEYQVYIPQLLIPPALDDNNFDGTDDWIDDRGDRFQSETGFLHDAFMPDDGEDWPDQPSVPFQDDIYGVVTSGWFAGTDNTYGDDYFEDLGKTHIRINADYMGRGREGSIEISKGGVLVVEEIFGGSPWVLFSHVLSGFAQGTDLSVTSHVIPEMVYYGVDTVYLKHMVADTNEPHNFDANYDPYHISYGYGETTITTFVGAKDPCSLVEPSISMPAILDPAYDSHSITLIPNADAGNPDLTGYPRSVNGTFLEIRVEVNNSTGDNWINTMITPRLPAELGNTSVELSYVAYPRPLVPAHYNSTTGEIVKGDQPGTFTTGWRFNQPEGEVLIKMGNTLNLMQPTRRAYFVFLLKIDPTLEPGIYNIPFTISGTRKHYSGANHGPVSYTLPDALFCITEKDESGNIPEFQKIILAHSVLKSLNVAVTDNFVPTGRIKWSVNDFGRQEFEGMTGTLQADASGRIDLSRFTAFPTTDTTQLVIMQEGVVDSYNTSAEFLRLTDGQTLNYTNLLGDQAVASDHLLIKPVGPRIRIRNSVYSINGIVVTDTIIYEPEQELYVTTLLTATNTGSDISSNTLVSIFPGEFYEVLTDSLDANCSFSNGLLSVDFGDIIPGEMKEQFLPFVLRPDDLPEGTDIRTLIEQSEIDYEGTLVNVAFNFTDTSKVMLDLYDFEATSITFDDLGNGQVQVNATAGNRGITGQDVWFRIYPIIGGGTYEFPIAEIRVENFDPLQHLELSGTYTLPVTDKSIEFIAIVDDGYDYVEITEHNNSIKTTYEATATDDQEALENYVTVYPMPFTDDVNFEYFLDKGYRSIALKVYDLNGRQWVELNNLPSGSGTNSVQWRNTSMPCGNYIYRLLGEDSTGIEEILFTGRLTKVMN